MTTLRPGDAADSRIGVPPIPGESPVGHTVGSQLWAGSRRLRHCRNHLPLHALHGATADANRRCHLQYALPDAQMRPDGVLDLGRRENRTEEIPHSRRTGGREFAPSGQPVVRNSMFLHSAPGYSASGYATVAQTPAKLPNLMFTQSQHSANTSGFGKSFLLLGSISDSTYPIERRKSPGQIDDVSPMRRRSSPMSHRDVRDVLPHLQLHLDTNPLLGVGIRRIKPVFAQRLQLWAIWPTLQSRFPITANCVVCCRRAVEQNV
jgi:hypothetical protein